MKKIFLFILFILFIPLISIAQVGINTTAPKAALDVDSSNNGVLIPRVQLIDALDNTTVVNPNAGPLETSTLIYNIAPAGVSPNNVIAGFYYWNNVSSRWIPIADDTDKWSLRGNAGTNPATLFGNNFAASENFIGTTDYEDVIFGTFNRPIMKMTAFGNLGIGVDNPFAKWHIYDESNYITSYINKRNLSGGIGPSAVTSPTFVVTTNSTGGGTNEVYHNAEFLANGANNATNVASYFSASQATNNFAIIVPENGGNVGIGLATPLQPLHVYKNSNTTKSSVLGEAIQTSTTTDFQNRGIEGYGSGTALSGGYGYGIGVMGIGDRANSYFATGVYAHLGTATPNATNTNQALFANGNSLGNAAIFTGGNVGIGTPIGANPSTLLHINSATNGAVRIVDGTEGNKKVLTSDATGVATWQPVGIENIQANLSAVTGISISYTDTANFIQTGASITLPPGRYAVNVTMLLSTVPGAYTNSNEAFWVRSSFSESIAANPSPSFDIIGSNLISGNLVPSTLYSLLTGMVVINNTSTINKTYYYVAGRVVTNNSTRTIAFFGGSYWAEDNIIAYRLN